MTQGAVYRTQTNMKGSKIWYLPHKPNGHYKTTRWTKRSISNHQFEHEKNILSSPCTGWSWLVMKRLKEVFQCFRQSSVNR